MAQELEYILATLTTISLVVGFLVIIKLLGRGSILRVKHENKNTNVEPTRRVDYSKWQVGDLFYTDGYLEEQTPGFILLGFTYDTVACLSGMRAVPEDIKASVAEHPDRVCEINYKYLGYNYSLAKRELDEKVFKARLGKIAKGKALLERISWPIE